VVLCSVAFSAFVAHEDGFCMEALVLASTRRLAIAKVFRRHYCAATDGGASSKLEFSFSSQERWLTIDEIREIDCAIGRDCVAPEVLVRCACADRRHADKRVKPDPDA